MTLFYASALAWVSSLSPNIIMFSSVMTRFEILLLVTFLSRVPISCYSSSLLSSTCSSRHNALIILELRGDLSYWIANLMMVFSFSPKSSMRFSRLYANYLIFVSELAETLTEVFNVHFPP